MSLRQLGPYKVLGVLGRGGMGVVYRARHQGAGRDVALKVLPRQRLSAEAAERFRREGEATAAIRHPNVVRIHDAGQWGEVLYLAYELVEGGRDLSDRVGRVSPEEAAALVAQVADGVGAAHALGIVHRDLKPANVLLDREGRPKVADFGVAREEGSQSLTKTGGIVGTPHYMAPECLRGEKATAASDVWSLGVILYQLVTGELPFQGTVLPQVMLAVSDKAPDALPRSVPRPVREVCARALSKRPAGRYCDAEALAQALREAPPARRAGSVAVVVGGVALLGVWGASRGGEPAPSEVVTPTSPRVSGEVPGAGEDQAGALEEGLACLRRGAPLRAAWYFERVGDEAERARGVAEGRAIVEALSAKAAESSMGAPDLEALRAEAEGAWALSQLGGAEALSAERVAAWDVLLFSVFPSLDGVERFELVFMLSASASSVIADRALRQVVNADRSVLVETIARVRAGELDADPAWPPERRLLYRPEPILDRLRGQVHPGDSTVVYAAAQRGVVTLLANVRGAVAPDDPLRDPWRRELQARSEDTLSVYRREPVLSALPDLVQVLDVDAVNALTERRWDYAYERYAQAHALDGRPEFMWRLVVVGVQHEARRRQALELAWEWIRVVEGGRREPEVGCSVCCGVAVLELLEGREARAREAVRFLERIPLRDWAPFAVLLDVWVEAQCAGVSEVRERVTLAVDRLRHVGVDAPESVRELRLGLLRLAAALDEPSEAEERLRALWEEFAPSELIVD